MDKIHNVGESDVEFDITAESVALVLISDFCKVDLCILLLLYEKYGRDIFYFFFMFTGGRVQMPNSSKMTFFMAEAGRLTQIIESGVDEELIPVQIKNIYNKKKKCFSLYYKEV